MGAGLNIARLHNLARTEKQAYPRGVKPENHIGNIFFIGNGKGFASVVRDIFDNMLVIASITRLIRNISGNA